MSSDDNGTKANQSSGDSSDLAAILASGGARKKGSRWLWRAAAIIVLAGAGYGYYVYSSEATAYTYATSPSKKGDLTVLVTATGSVEPTVQVDVSSEQSGTVREVLVDYNSTVKKGEVIARLDTARFEADVKSAEAALLASNAAVAKAEADMNSARVSMERQKTLVGNRVSTQQDLDSARYNYDAAVATKESAEANVQAAEASLEQSKVTLAKATIMSPIDGIVLSRDVDPGATVAASLQAPTLFKIAGDLREMELQVDIDEADVGQVAVGQQATFTVDAFPDKRFPAEITQIRYASETINDVVTYMGILTVRNDDLLLRQGMTATADIVVQAIRDSLLVPNAALRYTPPENLGQRRRSSSMFSLFRPPRMGSITAPEPAGGERTVWVMRNNVPTAVNIEIGSSDGQNTVVTKGDISEGDKLIIDATAKSG